MSRDKVYYVLFSTIHDLLKAEQVLKGQGVDAEVMPIPRALSSDCGVCIKSKAGPDVLEALLGAINGYRCFFFDGVGYSRPSGEKHE